MKNNIILAALLVGLFACTPNKERLQAENVELIKKYVAAVESMDFEAMNNYLADSYMGLGPSYGDTIYKAQAVENWKSNVENLYERIQYTRSQFAAVTIKEGAGVQGEWVGNWAELNITYKNGDKITIWANTNYLIENGRIARSLTLYNEADALRQLGFSIVSDEE
jgi:hypothetical protein